MRSRAIIFSIVVVVALGLAGGAGAFLAQNISANPSSAQPAQVVAGRFPLSFQGILLDADGNAVSNGSHTLTFAIYDDPTASGPLWSETQTVFTLDGLFTVNLGVEEEIDPSIFSENQETFLSIRVGNNPELTPRIQMAYGPYAMHALTAERVLEPAADSQRVAMDRWYEANTSGVRVVVDEAPEAVAFDGKYVWVATQGSDNQSDDYNITKIDPYDASKLVEIPMESIATDMAYDGRYLWVVHSQDDSLTRIRPSGANSRTMPVDDMGNAISLDRPVAIAFDGAYIWVANQGSNSVSQIRASDGVVVADIPVGQSPTSIAFDGELVWVAHSGQRNISKIDPTTSEVVGQVQAGGGKEAIAFDGEYMWVVNRSDNSVTRVRASDNTVIDTYDVGQSPTDIAFDGASMWVVNQDSDDVTKLRASDGLLQGTFDTGDSPAGIAFDGTNLWISIQENDTVIMR